jgi:hypothetical protein
MSTDILTKYNYYHRESNRLARGLFRQINPSLLKQANKNIEKRIDIDVFDQTLMSTNPILILVSKKLKDYNL